MGGGPALSSALLSGWALVLLGLALYVSNPLLVAIAVGFVLVVARAWRDTGRRLAPVRVRREVVHHAYEGDTVPIELVVENRGSVPLTHLRINERFRASAASSLYVDEPGPLPGLSRARLRLRTECTRGFDVYGVGPLTLEVQDDLGLAVASRSEGEMSSFSLFPRVFPVEGLVGRGARTVADPQALTRARAGTSLQHLGLRDYQRGDDPRRINWKATARRDALTLNEFESDLSPAFALYLDLHAAHRAGLGKMSTRDWLIRVGASLLWTAAREGYSVQLHGEGSTRVTVPPGTGEPHLAFALHQLIGVQQTGSRPLGPLVRETAHRLPVGATVVLLYSALTTDPVEIGSTLDLLVARGLRPWLVVIDTFAMVAVAERRVSEREAEVLRAAIQRMALERGVPLALVDGDEDLEERLRAGLFRPESRGRT